MYISFHVKYPSFLSGGGGGGGGGGGDGVEILNIRHTIY
jgi:hypothetical protein